jgi:hypothetical protein
MCPDCWDGRGVCGCPDSYEAQADMLAAKTPPEKAAIFPRARPAGGMVAHRR